MVLKLLVSSICAGKNTGTLGCNWIKLLSVILAFHEQLEQKKRLHALIAIDLHLDSNSLCVCRTSGRPLLQSVLVYLYMLPCYILINGWKANMFMLPCYILIHGWKANKHMHACKCSVASMSAACAAEARSAYTYTTASSLRVTHRVSHVWPETKTELAWREQWGSLKISAFFADSWSWITWWGLWSWS